MKKASYKNISKQFKRHTNDEQFHPHKTKEDFYSSTKMQYHSSNPKPLKPTAKQLEDFFWKNLVGLGWKKNTMSIPKSKSQEDLVMFTLVCQECDVSMNSMASHTLTFEDLKEISSQKYVDEKIKEHLASERGCKPHIEE